jgi:hypothetical protein
MPTKHLPSSPNLDHLKYQAKDLLKGHQLRTPEAMQRIREFHPRFHHAGDVSIAEAKLTLSDAHLAIAREYGFPSWTRLKAHIEKSAHADLQPPHHERIADPAFSRAVELLDSGDADGLHAHLNHHPGLVHQRVLFEGGNYFSNPSLLEFAAENPIRHGSLPSSIVQVAKVILDAGGKADSASIESTLTLVCSGKVPRECNVQVPLIDLLCDYGADPNSSMLPALVHGELEAVVALIRRGAKIDLTLSAATGRTQAVRQLLQSASDEDRHRALALAAQHGHAEIVRLLLDAGEDPNRYNPMGCHSHSTPLHQAVLYGHEAVVRLLVERGAKLDIKDILFQGTPLGWAKYARHIEIEKYLQAKETAIAEEAGK